MNPSAAARSTWQNPGDVRLIPVDAEKAAHDGSDLADDVLLQVCRLSANDPQVTTAWLSRVRLVARLLDDQRLCQHARLEAAMTLLASALGQLTQFNPTHLPFGYQGPELQSRDWMERRALERVGKQIVGLIWRHASAEAVAVAVECAVSESIRLGFLEQRQYDAWRPGMRSGSGWRWAVTATPYGVMKANQAAASHGDVEIAETARPERNDEAKPHQMVGHPHLTPIAMTAPIADGPTAKAPSSVSFPSMKTEPRNAREISPRCQGGYPAVVSTHDCLASLVNEVLYWRNGVLPFYWGGAYHPGDFSRRTSASFQRSLVWLEARDHRLLAERLQRTYGDLVTLVDNLDARYRAHPAPCDATESEAIKRESLLPCYDKTREFVELLEEVSKVTEAELPRAGKCTTADQEGAESSLPSDDRYDWARQIDLVRATNQVLGEGMLNKGVLSRACADGQVETNGKTGRGARVRVRSFLTWVSRQNQLGAEETNQIRNAVIGEISSRNS